MNDPLRPVPAAHMCPSALFCGGMIRSGSTLQFQIAAHLVESRALGERWSYLEPADLEARLLRENSAKNLRIIKTHVPTPTVLAMLAQRQALALYCYRDIRDVALSAMRAFKVEWPEFRDQRWIETAIEAEHLWTQSTGVLVQRYEDLVADLPSAITHIAQHIGIALQPGEATELANRFGIEAQRERLHTWEASAPAESAFHPQELLRRGHLAPNGPGRWQEQLPATVANELTARFRSWLESHAYPLHAASAEENRADPTICVPHAGWLTYEQGDDVLNGLLEGDFEYAEQATLMLILRPGDVFVDCGAHCGLFTRLALECLKGAGHVAAIEPDPKSFQRLEHNTAGHNTHTVARYRLALGDADRTVAFQQEGVGRAAFNHVCRDGGPATVYVAQETLPTFVQRLPAPEITVMKMDCEGSEIAILRAAAPLLARGIPKVLMLEFNSENLRRSGGSCHDLVGLLTQHAYQFFALDPVRCRLEPRNPMAEETYANYFATRDPDWLRARIEQAPENARRKATDILQRGLHVTDLKRHWYSTIDKQKSYIGVLEHERDRLIAEAGSAQSEAKKAWAEASRATTDSQNHIDTLKAQLDQLADVVREQAALIAVLERERDRLSEREQQLTGEAAHYLAVMEDQLRYIKILEAERERTKPSRP